MATATAKTTERHGQQRPRPWGPWGIAFPFLQTAVTPKPPSGIEGDLVLLHQIVERGPADPEQLCSFRQIGAGLRKSELEHLPLGAGAGGPDAKRLRLFSLRRETEIGGREQRGVSHYDRPLHTIFELADIARPVVVVDRCKCRRGEAANRATVFRGEPPEKETGQNHSISKPLAERGHPHRDLIQAVIEVLAKA